MTSAVVRPHEAAVPRSALGHARPAVVENGHRLALPKGLRRYERYEERISVAPVRELLPVLHHAVDFHRHLKIDLHLARWLDDTVGDAVVSADAAVGRIDRNVQVI